ncbi:response regulator [Acidobacteria bacterium AB60]|nr:response regulator [Acidobacteria bacterium AB60]
MNETEARPRRILVVDDERLIADTFVAILQIAHHTARAAYSAEQALVVAEEFAPEVLLSDIVMEAMNGVELARHFVTRFPSCAVVLMTAHYAYLQGVSGMPELAHVRLVEKPLAPQQILDLVAALPG